MAYNIAGFMTTILTNFLEINNWLEGVLDLEEFAKCFYQSICVDNLGYGLVTFESNGNLLSQFAYFFYSEVNFK
jgi:hypothetical protein